MKIYEVVRDHKTGCTKVVSREERGPVDPFSNASMRRHEIGKRSRLAALKSWAVALKFAWRDRQARMRIVSHVVFFVALFLMPPAAILVQSLSHGSVDLVSVVLTAVLVLAFLGCALVTARLLVRRFLWRKS